MLLANTPSRYGSVAMTLHWLIAAALVVNICLGLTMSEFLPEGSPAIAPILHFHKSLGLTVLVLSLVRLGWRLANPAPPLPAAMAPGLRILAHASHFLLYVLIIGIPLSGWLMVSSSRSGAPTVWFGLFHWPSVPFLANLPRAQKVPLHHDFNLSHMYLAFSAIALVPIHIAAAFYHQRRGDDVLRRMLPGTKLVGGG